MRFCLFAVSCILMLFLKTDKRPYHYWKFFISFGIIPSIFGHLTLPYLAKSNESCHVHSCLQHRQPYSTPNTLHLRHITSTIDDVHHSLTTNRTFLWFPRHIDYSWSFVYHFVSLPHSSGSPHPMTGSNIYSIYFGPSISSTIDLQRIT